MPIPNIPKNNTCTVLCHMIIFCLMLVHYCMQLEYTQIGTSNFKKILTKKKQFQFIFHDMTH